MGRLRFSWNSVIFQEISGNPCFQVIIFNVWMEVYGRKSGLQQLIASKAIQKHFVFSFQLELVVLD